MNVFMAVSWWLVVSRAAPGRAVLHRSLTSSSDPRRGHATTAAGGVTLLNKVHDQTEHASEKKFAPSAGRAGTIKLVASAGQVG